jgi:hypothetical protein
MNEIIIIIFLIIAIGALAFFWHSKKNKVLNFQKSGKGCGNIFVYKVNNSDTQGITVRADREILHLSTTPKNFDIGETEGLLVKVSIGEKVSLYYCNDVMPAYSTLQEELIAESGQATISISEVNSKPNEQYTATVILKNVYFKNSKINIDKLIFKDIVVGWLPG